MKLLHKGVWDMREMKNSGIEWIGEFPSEWQIVKLKYLANILRGGSPRPIDAFLTDDPNGFNWIKIGDTIKGNKFINSTKQKIVSEGVKKSRVVHKGDLILTNSMSFGEPYILNIDGCIHDGWVSFSNIKNVSTNFLYYFLSSPFCLLQFKRQVDGGVVQNLNVEKIGSTIVLLPSFIQQERIADFLDKKCAEIDTVIEKTKATIEEYKKLKQSVITQAVTKGIRPNRPMKDSGIEWIGEVPADWNVVKASRLVVSTQNGLSRRDLEKSDGQIVLKLKNISPDGKISYSEINRIELTNKEIETYSLEDGDFLFVRVNGSKNLVGKCAIYKDISEIVAYNDHIIRVRLNEICNKRYFQYYLQSSSGKTEIDLHTSTAAGQFTISGEGLRGLYIVLPSNYEQNELADYLDKKCCEIDELIAKKTSLLSELERYKKSLIYEYVIGKKEVI